MPINSKGLYRAVFGDPIPSSAHEEERLKNHEALAVLSSDALSSVAYATQEIVLVLGLAGAAALHLTIPITGLIVALMVIVGISYRQTIKAYPHGGGSYTVSHENLGAAGGLVAGAALAIDYVLTVAVSVAAGIDAVISYFPTASTYRVEMCIAAVAFLTIANLRGVRASAGLLSIPTYAFISMVFILVVGGHIQLLTGTLHYTPEAQQAAELAKSGGSAIGAVTPFLLMRAFSSGCTAMTGIEAISNGVMVFYPIEWKNARRVLTVMVALLAIMFAGVSSLAVHAGVVYRDASPTVLYQLGRNIFGDGLLLLMLQIATLLVLLLAANTAYADFPRLAALLAQDGYMPRQLAQIGDRLVFDNGIKALGVLSIVLLIVFGGQVNLLIGTYAVGVFACFSLSQAGMVVHWRKEKGENWKRKAAINGFGSLVTGIVTAVLLISKFIYGAWLILVITPALIAMFRTIKKHYRFVSKRLSLEEKDCYPMPPLSKEGAPTIILIGQLHRGSYEAVHYARTIASDLMAIHVDLGTNNSVRLQNQWKRVLPDVPLVILDSPYRSLIDPVVDFVKEFESKKGKSSAKFCNIVLPVFVPRRGWQNLLHNQSTYFLRGALRRQGTRVVTTVGFYL